MSHYQHLSIMERENLLVMRSQMISIREIARRMGRSASTISRELKRNIPSKRASYSAVKAQQRYEKRRKKCCRKLMLSNDEMYEKVRSLIVGCSWSPEEIAKRLKKENNRLQISYATIYRAINRRMFDPAKVSTKVRGFKRNLRHKGKPRKSKETQEKRGQVSIIHSIEERPEAANNRSEIGHYEADTVAGTRGSGCIVTMVDRMSRYLLGAKLPSSKSELVTAAIIQLFQGIDPSKLKSVTPDRGKEFTDHRKISASLSGVPFYFAHPHSPWEKPTVENTNGLLREYFPKRTSFEGLSPEAVQEKILLINMRPRKCLGWKTPFEVFFGVVLHLT